MNKATIILAASLGLSLSSVSQLSQAQQAAATAVTIQNSQGVNLRAFRFGPATSAQTRKAIVMMHGCSGAYSYSQPNATFTNVQTLYRDWATTLVNSGHVVLLVDSFSNRVDPVTGVAVKQSQCGNGASGVSEVNDRPLDALAGYNYLTTTAGLNVDPGRVALLGWSHGGTSVMATLSSTQTSQPFKGGLAFYPGCGMQSAFGGISQSTYTPYASFKILHADLDPLYTVGSCQTRRDRSWILGGAQFQIIDHYADADHSFDGCKAVSSSCTQADVTAKATADATAVNYFSDLLM